MCIWRSHCSNSLFLTCTSMCFFYVFILESGTRAWTRPSLPDSIKMCSLCLWPLTSPRETTESLWHVFLVGGWGGGMVGIGVGCSKAKWLFSTWRRTTALSSICTQEKKKRFQIEILDLTARCVVCNWQWCYRWSHLRNLTFYCMFTEANEGSPKNHWNTHTTMSTGVLCNPGFV